MGRMVTRLSARNLIWFVLFVLFLIRANKQLAPPSIFLVPFSHLFSSANECRWPIHLIHKQSASFPLCPFA
ncbi:hypothetical protein HDK64DRAFT_25542 [Phyllosticta capitalensis]